MGVRRDIAAALQSSIDPFIFRDSAKLIEAACRGAARVNPGAEIEALPYVLRELLASDLPDSPPGRALPAPKPSSPCPVPCRFTVYFPRHSKAPRRGHPVSDWRRGVPHFPPPVGDSRS